MSLTRFEQIKRYFKACDPRDEEKLAGGAEHGPWYHKIQAFFEHIFEISRQLYDPGTFVTVDEVMVRFDGRSSHIYIIRNKPIPIGYKVIALAGSKGFTFAALPVSRVAKSAADHPKIPGLSDTDSVVASLFLTLSDAARRAYCAVMDNFFSHCNLFEWLRDRNIGAFGTCRLQQLPTELKKQLKGPAEDWGTVLALPKGNVLALAWFDKFWVTMLTTVHDADQTVMSQRRKPRDTSAGSALAAAFGSESIRELRIPKFIDDYNHNKSHVDVADQLRSYSNSLTRSRRNWFPLFLYLLEVSLCNSFALYRLVTEGGQDHTSFRLAVVGRLLERARVGPAPAPPAAAAAPAVEEADPGAADEVDAEAEEEHPIADVLPACRLDQVPHLPIPVPTGKGISRPRCWFCLHVRQQEARSAPRASTKCTHCNVFLCFTSTRNCYREFHEVHAPPSG
jgi:hypothetical protein